MLRGAWEYRLCIVGVQGRRSVDSHLSGFAYLLASSNLAVVVYCGVLSFRLSNPFGVLTIPILSDSIQSHSIFPTHALTPYKDCEKLAEGK